MIGKLIKTFLILYALTAVSCSVQEPLVQNQLTANINAGQTAAPNQNANAQISSNTNIAEPKSGDNFAHIKPEHRDVLQEWLKTRTYLRPAIEETDNSMYQEKYKEYFAENMKFLRETVGEDGYQYYSTGDMNQDGKIDFALLLVDSRPQEDDIDAFALAIFNAPFKKGQKPAYYEENLYGITNAYIVFDKMTKKHLFLGKLESDVYCATYYPKKQTYYFKDCF